MCGKAFPLPVGLVSAAAGEGGGGEGERRVLHCDHMVGLKDNVHKLLFTKWEEIWKCGALEEIFRHENPLFFNSGVQSIGKYRA